MNKRQQQKEATRSLLLQSASSVYAREGFSVPVGVIAKEAGVSHGTLFAHFSTVDDLMECVVQQFGRSLTERLHDLSDSMESLDIFFSAHIDILSENEQLYTRIISERALLPETVAVELVGIQSATSSHLQRVVEPLQKTGEIIDIPLSSIFNTWMGLIHYYLQNRNLFLPRASGSDEASYKTSESESVLRAHKKDLVSNYTSMLVRDDKHKKRRSK